MKFGAAPNCPCGRSKNPTPMMHAQRVGRPGLEAIQHVYMAMSYGFAKIQTSDGAQVARALLPYQPSMIFVLPNEALLIALRDQTIAVVHLQ